MLATAIAVAPLAQRHSASLPYVDLTVVVTAQSRLPNQLLQCFLMQDATWGVMASHRSGETEDSFLADLSVGLATGQIKTGAPCRCC